MNKPVVVSNTTPLILLQKIGQLELIQKLYTKIYIAEAVYQETVIEGNETTSRDDFVSKRDWIEIVEISNKDAKKMFTTNLHEGEVETMILAIEKSADLCIIDDLIARKYAKKLNLNITGTLGVVIVGKKRGIIKEVKPMINQLIDVGMYIGTDLYSTIISIAGE